MGMFGSIIGSMFGKKKNASRGGKSQIESAISNIPTYSTSEHAKESAEALRSGASRLKEFGEESVQRAKDRFVSDEAPGSKIAREDIAQSTATSVQDIKEAGGGSASSLGAIAKAQATQQDNLRALAQANQQYAVSAEAAKEDAILRSMSQQAGYEAQASGMEAQAGMTLAGEDRAVYESELKKQLTDVERIMFEKNLDAQRTMARESSQRSLVGNIVGGLLSDRRAKDNIVFSKNVNGVNFYWYNYKSEFDIPGDHFGVMADEVSHIDGAVLSGNVDGYDRVDYNKVLDYINRYTQDV